MKEYQIRRSENVPASDPSIGRRMSGGDHNWNSKVVLLNGLKSDSGKFSSSCKGAHVGKRHMWFHKNVRSIAYIFVLVGFFFLLDSLMVSIFDSINLQHSSTSKNSKGLKDDRKVAHTNKEKLPVKMYGRLLSLASSALTEVCFIDSMLAVHLHSQCMNGTLLSPQNLKLLICLRKSSSQRNQISGRNHTSRRLHGNHVLTEDLQIQIGKHDESNGYIMVSANGGLNQQRVAICNAVAVASLLNATLVLPRFLYSNVWKDPSQFGDIYQEEYFISVLKHEVNIVKELPSPLKSIDIEAIGSLITDADIAKEAKPIDYVRKVLPILVRNGVVHFLGYGNRLGFDPLPSKLQRLRCKCNFHALKFVPKIQEAASLLVRRIRKHDSARSMLDKQLLGNYMPNIPSRHHDVARGSYRYLALHLRFEEDMVAYSQCDFGGGESERKELQAYREIHFPLLIERLKSSKPISPEELRKLGRCPLTPEEAALLLSALGFKHGTYIYLAGSQIYGANSRMQAFTSLYPNLVTKETLLTPSELEPFRNFSSQLAALDFIACATADVFAMTDSGSQLSSLVSGFRTYYGNGQAPTLRPNKKRLAAILSENSSIRWNDFEDRVRKMIEEVQRVRVRGFGRSIYRQPRSPECMCRT